MTALLVLLALLSLAMLASSQGAFDELIARAATPVLVVTGLALSPAGLGFFTGDTLRGLDPAVDVGVAWLALLAGLRASSSLAPALATSEGRRSSALAVLAALVVALVVAGILDGAAGLEVSLSGQAHVELANIAPTALLVGASLAGMPGDRTRRASSDEASTSTMRRAYGVRSAYAATAELVVLAAALGAYAVWAGPLHAAVVAGVGVVGAIVVSLLVAPGDDGAVPPGVAYLAVCVLVAGLCRMSALPGAVAGFVVGAVAAQVQSMRRKQTSSDFVETLLGTERPVRIVVTVVLAASTSLTLNDTLIGAAFAVGLVLVQYFVSLALVDDNTLTARLAATVATSTTPLVAVAAFASANIGGVHALLAPVIVAVAIADAFAFTMSLVSRARTRAAGAAP